MPVTKNTKTFNRNYQQWLPGELSNGDVLDVIGALGRPAKSVTIESLGGPTVVRFNVVQQIYTNQDAAGRSHIPDAAFYRSPLLMDEVEDTTKPNINIESGAVETWEEFGISDIKIVTKSTGLKIKVS